MAEHRDLARRMARIMHRLRERNPLPRLESRAGFYQVPSCTGGKPWTLPITWYPSPACTWSASGGCTMCNFGDGGVVTDETEALREFTALLDQFTPSLQGIFLAPGGSFFNPREVSPTMRQSLLGALHRFSFLRMVGMETRPEHVTEAALAETIALLPPTVRYMLIGFGLESSDPLVREVAVGKGLNMPQLEAALSLIDRLRDAFPVRLGSELYTLLKPPFLSEREAIDDAVRSIEWAWARGADTLGLFINVVNPQTLCAHLYNLKDAESPFHYEPAWWFSAFEVLNRLPPELAAKVQVLGPISEVAPLAGPRGCRLCADLLSGLMTAWNLYRDQSLLVLTNGHRCHCRDLWLKELDRANPSLADRIPSYLTALEVDFGLCPNSEVKPQNFLITA